MKTFLMWKVCKNCSRSFSRNKKYSDLQWNRAIFCSLLCFGKDRREKKWTHTPEARKKLSVAHKGTKKPWSGRYKHSREHNRKISEGVRLAQGRFGSWNKGRRMPDHVREILRAHATGANNWNWKGGKETLKERKVFYQRRRELRKAENGGLLTFEEWNLVKKLYDFTCPKCGRSEPEIKLTIDHIKPISFGGKDSIENIQPLCNSCNSRKNKRFASFFKDGSSIVKRSPPFPDEANLYVFLERLKVENVPFPSEEQLSYSSLLE